MRLSLCIQQITCVMPLLADVLHEGFEEGRAAVDGVHAEITERKEAEAHLIQESMVDEQQQAIQGFRWKEIHNLLLNMPVAILLLTVDFIRMCPYLHLYFLLDVFCLQLAYQLKMRESSIKLVGEDCNHDSENLRHDVSPKDSDRYQCKDSIYALNGIFRCDIAIGDGGDYCYTVVHDVSVHLLPAEDQSHLVERPTVVHPAEIGGIRTIVIILVYPQADHIEEEPHIMRIDETEDYQLDHQVGSVESDVKLSHSLELDIDPAGSPDLGQPDHFKQIQKKRASCQRHYH